MNKVIVGLVLIMAIVCVTAMIIWVVIVRPGDGNRADVDIKQLGLENDANVTITQSYQRNDLSLAEIVTIVCVSGIGILLLVTVGGAALTRGDRV